MNALSSELLLCFFKIKIWKAAAVNSRNGKYLWDGLCSSKLVAANTLKFYSFVTKDYRL